MEKSILVHLAQSMVVCQQIVKYVILSDFNLAKCDNMLSECLPSWGTMSLHRCELLVHNIMAQTFLHWQRSPTQCHLF